MIGDRLQFLGDISFTIFFVHGYLLFAFLVARVHVFGETPQGNLLLCGPPHRRYGGRHRGGNGTGEASDGPAQPLPHRFLRGVVMAEVRAELVANVVSVFVDEGEAVEDGDTLVMLESMKMEIPVVAEGDGTVRKIVVKEGDTVQRGDLIAVVD